MVQNEIKYVAELELRLENLPPVICQPQQIGQVLMKSFDECRPFDSGQGSD